jgi:hypothetical protein
VNELRLAAVEAHKEQVVELREHLAANLAS